MLPQPTGGQLIGSVVSPPSNSLQWVGGAGVDHYDLYRSPSSLLIGQKINVNPLHDSGSPNYTVLPVDDGVNTISAPSTVSANYYKLVASDASGNYGLISDSVQAFIESAAFVKDPVLSTIISALRADATLMNMLGNQPTQIRRQKRIREQGDAYPFVVVWRNNWTEDPKMKDQRLGTLTYVLSVVNNTPSADIVTNVLNRLAALLDGEPGKNIFSNQQNASAMVFMSMFTGGGPELFSETEKLWFQEGRLKITCQLFST